MSVTPQVYQFNPGARNGAAIIEGVKRVMDFAGTHHWEIVPGSYIPNVEISLRTRIAGDRILRLVARTSGTAAPTIDCYYSFGGGAESYACLITGGTTTYELNDPSYGMSSVSAYVVEIEDAIFICTHKPTGSDGGSTLLDESLGAGVHAGRIASSHNKSDSALGLGEEGMLCGQTMVYENSPWAMLSFLSTSAQSAVWTGNAYSRVSFRVSNTDTDFRSKDDTISLPLLENVGDNQTIERLTPFPLILAASSATSNGHASYLRYMRARKFRYGDTAGGTVIDNATVFPSAGDPDIGWRHNFSFNNAATIPNLVVIWCPPGDEVNVDI